MTTPVADVRTQPSTRSDDRFTRIASILLLIVGIQLWLIVGRGEYGAWTQRWMLMAALLIAAIPPFAKPISLWLGRLRSPSPRARAMTAIAVAIVSSGYFALSVRLRHEIPILKFIDERSYSIGAHMVAQLRLWMPQHPAADFFEALNLIVHPLYASAYFPGTAIFYAPSVWLHLPYWVWAILAMGVCCGLIYRIASELVDGLGGLLCAIMMPGSRLVRVMSTMIMSQIPMLLLLLLIVFAWLRWSKQHHTRWMVLIGALVGWAIITRPLDAVVMLLPVAMAIVVDLTPHWKKLAACAVIVMLASAPFIAIQLIFNVRITGSVFTSPYQMSAGQDYPALRMGFYKTPPTVMPATSLPQKLEHNGAFVIPELSRHRLDNMFSQWLTEWLHEWASFGVPQNFLLVLLPLSVLAWKARRWVVLAMLPLWVGLYILYPILLVHYVLIAVPAITMSITAGTDVLRRAWPRMSEGIAVFTTLAIVILSITRLPELNRNRGDDWFDPGELRRIDQAIDGLPGRAVVLFRYASKSSHVEPVFNTDVAWPDDARVVRAHDLGPRNHEILRYYAEHQPDRMFYLYDRASGTMHELDRSGNVTELPR